MADSNRRAPGLRAGIAALTGLAALSGGCGGLRGLDYGRGPCQGGEPRIAADSAALTWVENPDRAAHPVTTRDQTLALLATDQDMTAAP